MKNYLTIMANKELLNEDMELSKLPVKTLLSSLRKENNSENEEAIIKKLICENYYDRAQKEFYEIIDKYEEKEVDNLIATGTYKPGVFLLCAIDIESPIKDMDIRTILKYMIGDNCNINQVTISKGVFEKRKDYHENDLKNSEIEKEIVEEYNKRCYENS